MPESSEIQDSLQTLAQRSAKRRAERRYFLGNTGVLGLGGLSLLGFGSLPTIAQAQLESSDGDQLTATEQAVLNFALNAEYLGAEYYLHAVSGGSLPDNLITGKGTPGMVTGGHQVSFATPGLRQIAREFAADEVGHVRYLRAALGSAAVARPAIDLMNGFNAAAHAAGVVGPGQFFDPFADEVSFLLGAFIIEDVDVTAYKGASPLLQNKAVIEAAAGILAVEAYHAGSIRTSLFARGVAEPTVITKVGKISNARDSLDSPADLDQGIVDANGKANIVPADANGLAFSRTAPEVLNILYLTPQARRRGGFFPQGVNGAINLSSSVN